MLGEKQTPKTRLRRRNQHTKDHTPCPFQIQNKHPAAQTLFCPPRNGEDIARLPDNCAHPPTLLPGVPAPSLPLESGSGVVGTHPSLGTYTPTSHHQILTQGCWASHFREAEAEACREQWTIRGPEPAGWQS